MLKFLLETEQISAEIGQNLTKKAVKSMFYNMFLGEVRFYYQNRLGKTGGLPSEIGKSISLSFD